MSNGVGTTGFDIFLTGMNTGTFGLTCRDWALMTSELDRQARIVPVLQATGSLGYGTPEVHAVIDALDGRCLVLTPPTGADLAPSCAAWSALTHAEKLTRIRAFFDRAALPFGGTSGPWVSDSDIAQVFTQIEQDCVASGTADINAANEAARVLANTRIQAVLSLDRPLPADLQVVLSNTSLGFSRPMSLVSGLTFELASLQPGIYTVSISGTGLVSRQQQVGAVADHVTTVHLVLQTQLSSIRVAIVLPPGASPSSVTVTGVPNISRQPDGSWAASNVPPGRYDVVAAAPGMVQQHQTITMAPGQAVPVGFALSYSPASVTVTVNAHNASVMLDGRPMMAATANTFTATVQPGEHVLAATADGYAPAQQNITLSGGQAGSATFTLTELPPVCAPVPGAWSSEQERTDWIAAHAHCPPPTPYCPPLPTSFATEVDRQAWINLHATCPAPAPWVNPCLPPAFTTEATRVAWMAANPTCPPPPESQETITTRTATAAAAVAAEKTKTGWKWAAGLVAVVGGAALAVKRQKESAKHEAARHNPSGRTKNTFKVGDLVAYKRKFLQSIQWFTDVPINGRVEEINESMQMPKVLWNDRDEAILVHPGNLVLWKSRHLDHS